MMPIPVPLKDPSPPPATAGPCGPPVLEARGSTSPVARQIIARILLTGIAPRLLERRHRRSQGQGSSLCCRSHQPPPLAVFPPSTGVRVPAARWRRGLGNLRRRALQTWSPPRVRQESVTGVFVNMPKERRKEPRPSATKAPFPSASASRAVSHNAALSSAMRMAPLHSLMAIDNARAAASIS